MKEYFSFNSFITSAIFSALFGCYWITVLVFFLIITFFCLLNEKFWERKLTDKLYYLIGALISLALGYLLIAGARCVMGLPMS